MTTKKYAVHTIITLIFCLLLVGCSSSDKKGPSSEKQTSPSQSSYPSDDSISTNGNSTASVSTPEENEPTATPLESVSITISAAGDCTFGSDVSSPASVNFYSVYDRQKNDAYFFKKVKKFFETDDLTLVNLEGTLSESTTRMDKTYAFKGSPSYVNILTAGSVEAVSFANNHCSDYGESSYQDTITSVTNAGIKLASYNRVCIYKTKGKRIGMIAVNGLLGLDYSKGLVDSGIKKLKNRKADLIIVSMHAGIEHTSTLNFVQEQLAHYAVDKGANLVLGHHPHTLQGIEKYKKSYIVYSLANFCFGGNTNPSDKDTMIFQQTFTFEKNSLIKDNNIRIIPCRVSSTTAINDYQPTPLKGAEKQRVIQNINTFSKPFNIQFTKAGTLKQ